MKANELTEEQIDLICNHFNASRTDGKHSCYNCPFAIIIDDDYWSTIDQNGAVRGGHYECASYMVHTELDAEVVQLLSDH